jgi:hypothetical protein
MNDANGTTAAQDLPPGLDAVRARLARAHGPEFYAELEALAAEPALGGWLKATFPALFARSGPGLERREFLRLAGASLGVMGVSS